MVAPDRQVGDRVDGDAELLSELGLGAVVVLSLIHISEPTRPY